MKDSKILEAAGTLRSTCGEIEFPKSSRVRSAEPWVKTDRNNGRPYVIHWSENDQETAEPAAPISVSFLRNRLYRPHAEPTGRREVSFAGREIMD